MVVVFLAVGTVWLRLSIVRTTYQINQTELKIKNTRKEIERLELEVARLRSPRRLSKLAIQKFGLQRPQAQQIVHLKGNFD